MRTPDHYCYRVEKKTVKPGRQRQDKTYQTEFWVIFDRRDERPVTKNGTKRKRLSDLFTDDYFQTEAGARRVAYNLHKVRKCTSKRCKWTHHQDPPEKEDPPAGPTFRYFAGGWPMGTPKKP